jgi:glycosyltransferase involved in cell wall biosynthesis
MFDNFGPYHVARFRATQHRGEQEGCEVFGLETLGTSPDYAWLSRVNPLSGNIITLFPSVNQRRPPSPLLGYRVLRALTALRADVLAICGYQGAVSLTALVWAKTRGKIPVLMSESSHDDKERHRLLEWGKRQVVHHFDAALVGGEQHKEYAKFLGIPEGRIFLGYDVVDNDHFAKGAAAVRQQAQINRQRFGLPHRYFLTVSRFIPKKNLAFLLETYRHYRQQAGRGAWDLVLCGSGPLEKALKTQTRDIPGVHFPGFQQVGELPCYYGLASVFILPSSYFEQWGLVVNEAMASGLPVLVSRACGCAPNLVREGVNGFTFSPRDGDGLLYLMRQMSEGKLDLEAMGEASRRIIASFTPETFAENLWRAMKSSPAYQRMRGLTCAS